MRSVSRWANPGADSQFPANCAGNMVSVPGFRRIAARHSNLLYYGFELLGRFLSYGTSLRSMRSRASVRQPDQPRS